MYELPTGKVTFSWAVSFGLTLFCFSSGGQSGVATRGGDRGEAHENSLLYSQVLETRGMAT